MKETGIPADLLEVGELTDIYDVNAPLGRDDKRGFSRGKRYFTTQVRYFGSGDLTLQGEEASRAVWACEEEIQGLMASVREEKLALVERSLSGL